MPGEVLAELMVIRHGQSTANAAFPAANAAGLLDSGVTGRDADVPLTPLGEAQAAGVGRWLAGLPDERFPEVACCSPYRRAAETVRLAFDQVRAAGRAVPEVVTDARLCDRLTGALELLTDAAIRERFPQEETRFLAAGQFAYCPPGGETMMDVAARLRDWYADTSARYAGRRIIVVAHDAVVLMLRHVIDGLSVDELAGLAATGLARNGSVTRWAGDGQRLRLIDYDALPWQGEAEDA